jgi:hypothetical protein
MNQSLIRASLSGAGSSENAAPWENPLRKAFIITGLVATLAEFVGLAVALYQNVGGSAEGGLARDTWLTVGTVYSAPLFFLILYLAFLAFSARPRWPGVLCTVAVMLMSAMSDLSAPGDWHSTADAFNQHFNVLAVAAVIVLLTLNVVMVGLGGLDLWTRARGR